jgi:hypothetical protein
MTAFKDLGIKPAEKGFTGDKIKMSKVLNKPIKVEAFKIEASKFTDKGNGKRLVLQVVVYDKQHIIITGSSYLQDAIVQVPKDKFPFTTTIVEEMERFEFT